jgi:hypothetical protein
VTPNSSGTGNQTMHRELSLNEKCGMHHNECHAV